MADASRRRPPDPSDTVPLRIVAPPGVPVGGQCDCWRLTRILGADEDLPGLPRGCVPAPGAGGGAVHICGDTARATLRAWVRRTFYAPSMIMSACLERPLAEATWADLLAVGGDNQLDWPLRHDGRALGLVIRQWADGADSADADAGLARRILEHPGWDQLVALQAALDTHPGATPAALARLCGLEYPEGAVFDPEYFDPSDSGVLFRLRQVGLPATPRTVRFLRAAVRGEADGLPGRGLLVETLVYMTKGEGGAWVFHDGNPTLAITGQHEFARREQFLRAYEVANRHRAWLGGFGPHPLTTRQAVAAALPTALAPAGELTLDYEREALDAANLAGLRRRLRAAGLNRQAAINRYLDEVYERVRKRRERAGEDTRPPQGWRRRAQAAILGHLGRPA